MVGHASSACPGRVRRAQSIVRGFSFALRDLCEPKMQRKEDRMKKIAIAGLVLVVLGAGVLISLRSSQSSSGQPGQMAALKQLRDTGVITAQEYESKVQAL